MFSLFPKNYLQLSEEWQVLQDGTIVQWEGTMEEKQEFLFSSFRI